MAGGFIVKKIDLIKSLQNENTSEEICAEVVEATFELLSSMVSLEQSLSIDGIGVLDAHYRKGTNKELPNENGVLAQKNLSIFFHPSPQIKQRVKELVEDESEN